MPDQHPVKTDYPHYEIILVDNQSLEPETHAYLRQLSQNLKIRLLSYDRPFNFSALNNFAVTQTVQEYLLFLNNDTEVLSPEWLRALLEHGLRQEVGAVGAKLLYPNQTIQHAGITMGGHSHLRPELPLFPGGPSRLLRPVPGGAQLQRRDRRLPVDQKIAL